jgi:hypothetical protein
VSVAEIDALLYKPGHPRDQLQRALRIPALSAGWRASLQALLDQQRGGARAGNAGLAPTSGRLPAWTGLRPLRVARKIRESGNVISLVLEPVDGHPLAAPLPGQFVVLRLKPASGAPALTRSYSVSGEPSTEHYRVSVKREPGGAAVTYIDEKLQVGDVVDASAPRGNFALSSGEGAVVFLSAGIGATPVLAMLHALAAGGRRRGRSGGSTALGTAGSILLPRRCAPSWRRCPTATAMSATARPIRRIARAWTSTLGGAWTCLCFRSWACRTTPTSTSADRPHS